MKILNCEMERIVNGLEKVLQHTWSASIAKIFLASKVIIFSMSYCHSMWDTKCSE
jgi:hypothetical protein